MKHLKLDSGKGYFSHEGEVWVEIDKIARDDLIALLELALGDDFEMDDYVADQLPNPAQQIVYKHIHEKLKALGGNKDRFRDESENLFKEAIEKYTRQETAN